MLKWGEKRADLSGPAISLAEVAGLLFHESMDI
jgi:hypothetical protein